MSQSDVKPEVQLADETVTKDSRRSQRGPHTEHRQMPWEWTEEDVKERAVLGKVAVFHLKGGRGTIVRDGEEKEEIEVHMTSLAKPNALHVVPSLDDGEAVLFDIVTIDGTKMAINVTSASGGELKGNEEAPKKTDVHVDEWAVHFIKATEQPTRHYGKVRKAVEMKEGEETESKTEDMWVNKWEEKDVKHRGVIGKVRWYNAKRGYGFIAVDDEKLAEEQPDGLFVHRTSILKPNDDHIIETLATHERVKFDISATEKGHEAINVTSADDGCVLGAVWAPHIGGGRVPFWAWNLLRTSAETPQGRKDRVQQRRVRRAQEDDEGKPRRRMRSTASNGEEKEKRRVRRYRKPKQSVGDAKEDNEVKEVSEALARQDIGHDDKPCEAPAAER